MKYVSYIKVIMKNRKKKLLSAAIGSSVVILIPILMSLFQGITVLKAYWNINVENRPKDCADVLFCEGEDLIYEVTWWRFKIGQIRIKSLEQRDRFGEVIYNAAAFIESYKGIPFVDLYVVAYTEMDEEFYSRVSHSIEKYNKEWWAMRYEYDRANRYLLVYESWHKSLEEEPYREEIIDTLFLSGEKFQDGLSLLFFARANVRTQKTMRVPTVAYGKTGYTNFRFTNTSKTVEVNSILKPIRVVEFNGKAEFEGIYGLRGDFIGWFSDDTASIPIKAQMKVLLGSIIIELKDWNRDGWEPPFAK